MNMRRTIAYPYCDAAPNGCSDTCDLKVRRHELRCRKRLFPPGAAALERGYHLLPINAELQVLLAREKELKLKLPPLIHLQPLSDSTWLPGTALRARSRGSSTRWAKMAELKRPR